MIVAESFSINIFIYFLNDSKNYALILILGKSLLLFSFITLSNLNNTFPLIFTLFLKQKSKRKGSK